MPKPVFVILVVFAAVVVLGAAWVGISYALVSPPGPSVTEERQVSAFTGVEIHGAGTLYISQGPTPSLVAEGKRRVLDRLTTTVRGNTLVLEPHGLWYAPITFSGLDRITYRLTVTELTRVHASGAAHIESEQPLTVNDLELSMSGAAKLTVELNGRTVTVSASGAGDITLSGSAEILDFKSSGASRLSARGFAVREATIVCSGAAKADVNASERLDVTISGAGSVTYTGDPHVTQSISGAGKVQREE